MNVGSLALRNLMRNRRRSLATLLALAIGSTAILLFGGYVANIQATMLTVFIRDGGHLQIQHRDYYHYGSGDPAAYGIADYEAIVQAIRADPALARMARVVTPMLQFGGVAGNYEAGVSRTVFGVGYVPEDVNRMRQWNELGVRERKPLFKLEGAPEESAVIGQGVARVLQLCRPLNVPAEACPRPTATPEKAPAGAALADDIAALAQAEQPAKAASGAAGGARIELLAGTTRGTPNVAALTVVAAEPQGFKEFDEVALIVPLSQAQKLVYGRAPPRATALLVQLHHTADMPEAAARLRALLQRVAPDKPLAVMGFDTLNPFYGQSQNMFDMIFGFIFALIGGIVLFTVGNTMNAAVVERTAEVGTLRAVGLRQSGIRALFITEGAVLGAVGAVVGLLAALLFTWAFNAAEFTWVPPSASERIPLVIMLFSEYRLLAGTTVGLVVIAVMSAWLPARRAARLPIVDALRHA